MECPSGFLQTWSVAGTTTGTWCYVCKQIMVCATCMLVRNVPVLILQSFDSMLPAIALQSDLIARNTAHKNLMADMTSVAIVVGNEQLADYILKDAGGYSFEMFRSLAKVKSFWTILFTDTQAGDDIIYPCERQSDVVNCRDHG